MPKRMAAQRVTMIQQKPGPQQKKVPLRNDNDDAAHNHNTAIKRLIQQRHLDWWHKRHPNTHSVQDA